MELTAYERDLLSGGHGEGVRLAMEVLVKMGELYGARRLLPVKSAHIDAAAYTTIWDAGTEFVEYLADHGARVAVPTTINPLSRDVRAWRDIGASEGFAEKSARIERAYLKMGVTPTWTCAPYQATNVPRFGEAVAWSESNAVDFVNSVVGARAERLPDLFDVCCAVTGRVPEYGLYLDENRAGDVLFRLEGFDGSWFSDSVDYAVLGYLVGERVVNRVPVIEGLPARTMPDDLKALSAAAASGGAVALFHAVGHTPEAPTVEAAFRGREGYETVTVTPADMRAMRERLDTAAGTVAHHVVVGCPHASFDELRQVAELLGDRRVAQGTRLWIMTCDTQWQLACRAGVAGALERAGATVTCDTCLMELDEGDGRFAGETFVTNSGKVAQYAPGINGVTIRMATLAGCVEAAVTGAFPKEAAR